MTRRQFTMAAAAGMIELSGVSSLLWGARAMATAPLAGATDYTARIARMPPLFCTAYITPGAPGEDGQEPIVAKYPLVIVPQNNQQASRRWRDRVKSLNPDIVMLGYQIVIEETTVPGPGHDIMKRAAGAWCTYPGGYQPRVNGGRFHVFDPRHASWRQAFLDACRATLASYPYDGLFLDQCEIFVRAHPDPRVRAEMHAALQATILALRAEFPHALLVGNSHDNLSGLNGEMAEGRPGRADIELTPFAGHASPRIDLLQVRLTRADDLAAVRNGLRVALSHGAFFGAAVDYQHVLWFDIFDDVVAGRLSPDNR